MKAPRPEEIRGHSDDQLRTLLVEAVRKLEAAGIESPLLEARILASHVLGVSLSHVIAGAVSGLTPEQVSTLEGLLSARCNQRIPIAYLRGSQEFYGISFAVTPDTLIPRPETEILVDMGIEEVRRLEASAILSPVILDAGCGSGCIAISVLAKCPNASAIGIDISAGALAVARANARAVGVLDRYRCLESDITQDPAVCGDVLLSNPPYIPTSDIFTLQPEVRLHEPGAALDGGTDGLRFYRSLSGYAMRCLRPGGLIAMECGIGQAIEIAELFRTDGYQEIDTKRDLAGIERVVIARTPGAVS